MWRVWVRRRGVYRVLVGKPEGRRPPGRPRRRWVDNIRMDLQEVGCGYMDWIGLAQDRDRWRTLVSAVMNLRVPWNAGDFLTNWKPISCSTRTLHRGVSKLRCVTFLWQCTICVLLFMWQIGWLLRAGALQIWRYCCCCETLPCVLCTVWRPCCLFVRHKSCGNEGNQFIYTR